MSVIEEKVKGTVYGVLFVAIFSFIANMISNVSYFKSLGISPLVIGIVIGMIYANTLYSYTPKKWFIGVTFSAKKILRFAIVFYGFRVSFQDLMYVGMEGFLVSFTMLTSTFILGSYIGSKIFKMDQKTSMLMASGASVCGAAAVLATEPVIKGQGHQTAISVSMVVLFGTISMFLYPVLYSYIIEPSQGFLHMSTKEFGIYVGASIHEVAQVVAVPAAILGAPQDMANTAVIAKMTRVILIAPMLILLGIYLSYCSKDNKKDGVVKLVIPWFAVYFIGMAGVNSLNIIPQSVVSIIIEIDTFLLTMAMTALGMGTIFSKFKGFGMAPLYTAGSMFLWLVVGGFVITKVICSF
jgi:uncharacterized integral membrane protein (TIGR00698 family)